MFLANRDELTDQACKECFSAIGIYPALEKASSKASLSAQCVVGSIASLKGSRLGRWPSNHFGLIIYDEAHFSLARSSQTILQSFSSRVLGVTATPNRSDKRNLGEYYEKITKELFYFDLVKKGRLAPMHFETVPIKIDLANVGQSKSEFGMDFDKDDLDCALEPYFHQIALEIQQRCAFRRTLVFLPLIKTSVKFAAACNDIGLSAIHVDGKSEWRDTAPKQFKRGQYEVMCNAQLFSYGFNDPGIDAILNLRLTQSISFYWQAIGRGTRVFPGKSDLKILECLYQHEKHGVIRPAHLIAKNDDEAQEMMELAGASGQKQFDLEDLQSSACASREEKLRRGLEKQAERKGKVIDAEGFCLSAARYDGVDYAPEMPHEAAPVSIEQMKVLAENSINPKSAKCRGHADVIISELQNRAMQNLASPLQLRKLIQMKHPNPHAATKGQAGMFIVNAEYRERVWREGKAA